MKSFLRILTLALLISFSLAGTIPAIAADQVKAPYEVGESIMVRGACTLRGHDTMIKAFKEFGYAEELGTVFNAMEQAGECAEFPAPLSAQVLEMKFEGTFKGYQVWRIKLAPDIYSVALDKVIDV